MQALASVTNSTLHRKGCLIMLLSLFSLCGCIVGTWSYKVPDVSVVPLENGFRVAIQDESGIKTVSFNVNRNREFRGFEEGEFSALVREPQDGRWQHDFVQRATLRKPDTIYVWTSVQHANGIYRNAGAPIQVCQLSGAHIPTDCSNVTKAQPESTTGKASTTQKEPPLTSSPQPLSDCGTTSETVMSPPARNPLCKGQLIFQEEFDHLNESRWLQEVRAPLDTSDAEFLLYDGKARVTDGQLIIEPKLWSSYRPDLQITNARLDLADRCTAIHSRQKECVLLTGGPLIMPPVVVPRLSTKESFAFKYGRIDIRARLPKGDWLVPLLLLEPLMEVYGQTGYESGQLRVAMIRANNQLRMAHGKLIDGRTILAGPVLSTDASQRDDFMVQLRRSVHFGDDYHVYTLKWSSQNLSFAIDGEDFGELLPGFADFELNPSWRRGGPMAPFDRMFYITLGLSVGGFGDFVDKLRTSNVEKPWLNKHPQAKLQFWQSQDDWLPTWKQPKLFVDYVRVYAI